MTDIGYFIFQLKWNYPETIEPPLFYFTMKINNNGATDMECYFILELK